MHNLSPNNSLENKDQPHYQPYLKPFSQNKENNLKDWSIEKLNKFWLFISGFQIGQVSEADNKKRTLGWRDHFNKKPDCDNDKYNYFVNKIISAANATFNYRIQAVFDSFCIGKQNRIIKKVEAMEPNFTAAIKNLEVIAKTFEDFKENLLSQNLLMVKFTIEDIIKKNPLKIVKVFWLEKTLLKFLAQSENWPTGSYPHYEEGLIIPKMEKRGSLSEELTCLNTAFSAFEAIKGIKKLADAHNNSLGSQTPNTYQIIFEQINPLLKNWLCEIQKIAAIYSHASPWLESIIKIVTYDQTEPDQQLLNLKKNWDKLAEEVEKFLKNVNHNSVKPEKISSAQIEKMETELSEVFTVYGPSKKEKKPSNNCRFKEVDTKRTYTTEKSKNKFFLKSKLLNEFIIKKDKESEAKKKEAKKKVIYVKESKPKPLTEALSEPITTEGVEQSKKNNFDLNEKVETTAVISTEKFSTFVEATAIEEASVDIFAELKQKTLKRRWSFHGRKKPFEDSDGKTSNVESDSPIQTPKTDHGPAVAPQIDNPKQAVEAAEASPVPRPKGFHDELLTALNIHSKKIINIEEELKLMQKQQEKRKALVRTYSQPLDKQIKEEESMTVGRIQESLYRKILEFKAKIAEQSSPRLIRDGDDTFIYCEDEW